MIWLTDAELTAITDGARPLPPKISGEFLQAVAAEIEHQQQRGPGAIYRACPKLQRKYFDPPDFTGPASTTEEQSAARRAEDGRAGPRAALEVGISSNARS
jgi:hypothetical protein